MTEQRCNCHYLSIEHGLIKYRSPVTNFVHVLALAGLEECHHAAPIYLYPHTVGLITAPQRIHRHCITTVARRFVGMIERSRTLRSSICLFLLDLFLG